MKSFLKKGMEEEKKAPIAVIVMGNPKYLDDPRVRDLGEALYQEIKRLLVDMGYQVELDPGEPYTQPRGDAAVWIGHSRGIDRLRFAPVGVKTIALLTMDHVPSYKSHDEQGLDPDHYKLSPADYKVLDLLKYFTT